MKNLGRKVRGRGSEFAVRLPVVPSPEIAGPIRRHRAGPEASACRPGAGGR